MCLDLMSGKRVKGKKFISKTVSLDELPQMLYEVQKGELLKVVVNP